MTEASSHPSLASLPTEILMAIVANLGTLRERHRASDISYRPDRTLCRLAQTCKVFRGVCLPQLYETVDLQTATTFPRTWRILNILATRPDLAGMVKRVILDAMVLKGVYRGNYLVSISAQDAALFNQILAKKLDMTTIAPLRELQNMHGFRYEDCVSLGETLASIALALVPNVTSIIFYRHQAHVGSFKPDAFLRLQELTVQYDDDGSPIRLKDSQGILGAAPNLRRLIGREVEDIPELPCPSVTQLVLLTSAVGDVSIARLPTIFPKLESFTYTYGSFSLNHLRTASPLALSKALLGLKGTLTHFEFACELKLEEMWTAFEHVGDHVVQSLSRMWVLQSLRLPAVIFDPFRIHDVARPESAITLVDFLPASIRSLYLDMECFESCQLQAILALAQAVPSQFRDLMQVAFPKLDESMHDSVRQAFAERGVACSFEETRIDTYDVLPQRLAIH